MAELEDKYLSLKRVLADAMLQAKSGKGKERHADDEPFQYQKICVINRWLEGSPVAGALFQAVKKTVESSRLSDSAAIHELRGAINYLAAAIILLEERDEEKPVDDTPLWGYSILDGNYRRRSTGVMLCINCQHSNVPLDDMPCKKCSPFEFRPHFKQKL